VPTRLLVLDFDGTMTDAEAEGVPFREGYLEDVAALVGHPLDDVHALARRFEAEVAAAPDDHGWIYNGRIVAPATVDPYLRIMPVARKIFDACGAFPSEDDRSRLLDGVLYKYNYPKTRRAFRPGAAEVLRALAGTETHVVTNSHTEPVQEKIRALGADLEWLAARVHGRAKKYVVDDAFTAVPESLAVPGLKRPVLLRRRAYHEALDGLRARAGCGWDEVAVVGDIFELDLALPLALGARVGLVANDFTPAYEKAFVAAHPRGRLLATLAQIPEYFKGA
jgi:FMN phosphatase YigB (HAD superfamily)